MTHEPIAGARRQPPWETASVRLPQDTLARFRAQGLRRAAARREGEIS